MTLDRCAPGIEKINNSCISLDLLIHMTKAYNATYKNKIELKTNLDSNEYHKYLLTEIDKRLNKKCNGQKCWTQQKFIDNMDKIKKKELRSHTFRPDGPQGKFEWLNTININQVMKQYENKYSNFKFLGAVPIDFDDLPVLGIQNIKFDDLENQGKNNVGVIFNLDEHYKSGSHWVAMFGNLNNGQIYYFDSYGSKPDGRIINLMKRIGKYCRHKNNNPIKKLDVNYNNRRQQFGHSECGVFSINFILRMLKGEKFGDVLTNPMSDEHVNKCRKIYFNNISNGEDIFYCE